MIKGVIVESGNQIDSQYKYSKAIEKSFRQYPKDFQMSKNMLGNDALSLVRVRV